MYGFELAGKPPTRLCFFIPERVLPDEFYTTLDVVADFELPIFRDYRIRMDASSEWIVRIREIIDANPEPRKHSRPIRVDPRSAPVPDEDVEPLQPAAIPSQAGRHGYAQSMSRAHCRLFYGIMGECARR